MAVEDVHELLTGTYGEIAGVTQQHSDELERLRNEIGIENLSPTEKAHMVAIGEMLGEVTAIATLAYEKSTTTPAKS